MNIKNIGHFICTFDYLLGLISAEQKLYDVQNPSSLWTFLLITGKAVQQILVEICKVLL